jgi:hypothetical protein
MTRPPEQSEESADHVDLTGLSPAQQAAVLEKEMSLRAIAGTYPVDLAHNTWQQYKPEMAEVAFARSARLRADLAAMCKMRLGGEFGAFVDETVRANRELTVEFLSRLSQWQMLVAHITFLRPMVYGQLCHVVLTCGFKPIDNDIVIEALKLKEARDRLKRASQSTSN